jgi:UDP-GlcNAc:undecaprenyl-phosphate/decaprenyl-phosphate GlcNAc-1-phosphate transferase
MHAALIASLIATLTATALTPIVRRVARTVGAVDAPGGRRVHTLATPRMGGAAILFAYLAAVLACLFLGYFPREIQSGRTVLAFLAGGVFIALVGAFDDIKSLGAKKKLAAQIVAASIAFWGGARITTLDVPLLGHFAFGPAVSYVLSIGWILAFVNAMNLIDGLDGLAGGMAFFAALTNLVVALLTGNVIAAVLNAALGGAVLGFLFYNFNPATIFMGDTGSLFLGFVLGTSALLSGRQKESTLVSLLVPVIALGLPLTDTLFTMVRRFLARRPIFSADRGHIHHRLLDLGLTHRRAVLILYGCSILLCVTAVTAAFGKSWVVGGALAGAVATLLGIARFAGYFETVLHKQQQRAHLFTPAADALRRELPSFLKELDETNSAPATWARVEELLQNGHFAFGEYIPSREAASLWHWERRDDGGRQEAKLVEAEFPIRVFPGSSSGTLRLGCLSEEADLPPQVEVLLQLVADGVEAALVRVYVERPSQMLRSVRNVGEA